MKALRWVLDKAITAIVLFVLLTMLGLADLPEGTGIITKITEFFS